MKKIYLLSILSLFCFYSVYAQNPVANFSASDTVGCDPLIVYFNDLSTNNPTSWQWSFTGGYPSSSSNQNPAVISYSGIGVYDVQLIVSNASGSNTLTKHSYITVEPAPPVPTITMHGDTLFCSSDPAFSSFQWYKDSMLLQGATNDYLIADTCAVYNVLVTNEYGCSESATSLPQGSHCLDGIIQNNSPGNLISLYPNPARNELIVRTPDFINEEVTVSIITVLGEVVKTETKEIKNNIPGGQKGVVLDVKSLPRGMYFVQVKNEKQKCAGRFVKE